MSPRSESAAPSRSLPLTILFVITAAICSLAIGTWIGARFFVPAGSGLAGPFIALGYGAGGALAGLVTAMLAARRLSRRWLVRVTITLAIGAAGIVGLVTYAYLAAKAEERLHLAEAYANLPPFRFDLQDVSGQQLGPLARIVYDSDKNEFAVTRADGSVCRGSLDGPQKVTLLESLRGVEGLLLDSPQPCPPAATTHRLVFRIEEALPPNTEGTVAFDAACLATTARLQKAIGTAEQIYLATQGNLRCEN